MSRRGGLSDDQMQLIAKALADPRRYSILKQIGAKSCAVPCTDVRERQPVKPVRGQTILVVRPRPSRGAPGRRLQRHHSDGKLVKSENTLPFGRLPERRNCVG